MASSSLALGAFFAAVVPDLGADERRVRPRAGAPTTADFEASKAHRLVVLEAQRPALLDARDNGTFDADVLAGALANLDADQ